MAAPPARTMQQYVDAVYDELKAVNIDTFQDLRSLLKHMRPDTHEATMNFIEQFRHTLSPRDTIFATLKAIRSKYVTTSMNDEMIKFTGKIAPADIMCLFVCGLLTYPSMSFLDWLLVETTNAYAHRFLRYMLDSLSFTIFVNETLPATGTATLEAIEKETNTIYASCFLCARENNRSNVSHAHTLVLDAFSHQDQFLEYDPAVWHLYCLWLFRQNKTDLLCYAAKTPAASYIFMVNYEEHIQKVIAATKNPVTDRTAAVRELVVKPLELYRRSFASISTRQSPLKPVAFVSRIWPALPALSDRHRPLAYAHLLMQRDCPLYADTAFNKALQDMIAHVVGKTTQDVIANLPYATPQAGQANPCPPGAPAADAYALLAQAHHRLMMDHAFVVLTGAKDGILFETPVTISNAPSKHRDYIGALADVRYNWVFEQTAGPVDIARITPPAQDAPYHEIDVYRHIIDLLRPHRANASEFLKRLSVGCYVTEAVNPQRSGVIVFDVQELGREHGYFACQRHGYQTLVDYRHTMTFEEYTGLAFTCSKFGIDTTKTKDESVKNAMLEFFKPNTNKSEHWCLSDMTFKYVVYNSTHQTFFMQDSFALIEDHSKPPSCADCRFCPACFLPAQQTLQHHANMYDHIQQTHPQFHLQALPPLVSVTGPVVNSPRAGTGQFEDIPSSDTSSSDRSHRADPPADVSHDQWELALRKLRSLVTYRDLDVASDTQLALSADTVEHWKKKYTELQAQYVALTKKTETEGQIALQMLEDHFSNVTKDYREHERRLEQALTDTSELHKNMKAQSEEHHRRNKEIKDEANRKEAEAQQEHEQKLQDMLDKHEQHIAEQRSATAALEAEIERLVKELEDHAARAEELERLRNLLKEKETEIERLTRDAGDAQALDHSALATQNQVLQRRVESLQEQLRNAAPPAAPDHEALRVAEARASALAAQLRDLRRQNQALEAHIARMTQQLENALKQPIAGLKHLKRTIAANVQHELTVSDLLPKMLRDPPDYKAVRDAMANAPAMHQRPYSPAATFLILESMGGTWCLWLKNEAELQRLRLAGANTSQARQQITAAEKRQREIFAGVMYDLTMWRSITSPKKTRYTSAYVQQFIQKFELTPDDKDDGEPSTDDEPDDHAAADAHAAFAASLEGL
jgi:hypothetical protein